MVKVEMPRGSWEILIDFLELNMQDFGGPIMESILSEIETQVYSQEY